MGADRTFGKGLVQNVESLPYNTALKYTVAKYYTPSGRCIQRIRYSAPDASKSKAAGGGQAQSGWVQSGSGGAEG